jgi:hypothetical protein
MLHDNWIEYFMAWTQICMVVYIFNEMHKTFLQLDLVAYYFWTFKTTNVSYNKLCGFFSLKINYFLNFNHMIKHIMYDMWKPKFTKNIFYFIFMCTLN